MHSAESTLWYNLGDSKQTLGWGSTLEEMIESFFGMELNADNVNAGESYAVSP